MESLDKAKNRIAQRLDPRVLDPVVVRTQGDIKRVLTEFDPSRNPESPVIPLHTSIDVNNNGKIEKYNVSANTKSKSKRDHLIEGMLMIQSRLENQSKYNDLSNSVEINGRVVQPPKLGNAVDGHTWIDPLINQWMGARRDGQTIYWDLSDGFRYKYDIFNHKLTRVPIE